MWLLWDFGVFRFIISDSQIHLLIQSSSYSTFLFDYSALMYLPKFNNLDKSLNIFFMNMKEMIHFETLSNLTFFFKSIDSEKFKMKTLWSPNFVWKNIFFSIFVPFLYGKKIVNTSNCFICFFNSKFIGTSIFCSKKGIQLLKKKLNGISLFQQFWKIML